MEYSIWNIPSGIWTANGISFATPGRTVFTNTVPQFPSLQTFENTNNVLGLEKLPQAQISQEIITNNIPSVQQSDSESNDFSDQSQNSEIESEPVRTPNNTELPEICNENDNATDTITNFSNYFNLNQIKIENPLAFINQQFNPVYNLMINHLNTKTVEHNDSDSEDVNKNPDLICNKSESSDKVDTDAYHCTICNIAVNNEVELHAHMKSFHLPNIYEHTQTNDDSSKYSCNSNNTINNAVSTETIDFSTNSSRKRKSSGTLAHHRIRYMREEYRCTLCPYTCTIEKAFYRHLRAHSATGNEGETDFTTPRVSCAICGKDRSSEVDMTKHMKKHRDNRFFCCDICVFRTVQLKKLIQHRRMHTGEKPHLCPYCVYRSARRDNLRSHVRRVHKEDRLLCDTFSPRGLMMTPTAREINAVAEEEHSNQA